MDNFTNVQDGYNKRQVNDFVDYVIKKTEENILTIKKQKDEIESLKLENQRLKQLENSYVYIQNKIEDTANEIKANAKYEADLIIKEAKDNASMIVNDALLKSKRIKEEKESLEKSVELYKRNIKRAMKQQLEIMEDIEIL